MRQRTLKDATSCAGIGLHSGQRVAMTLRPAGSDHGIVFVRKDVSNGVARIAADHRCAVRTAMCVTLGNAAGVSVATVEHLMAAFAGLGVDNAVVELDGPEPPIMDGSAAAFVAMIDGVGTAECDAPRRAIEILRPVAVADGLRSAALYPGTGFSLGLAITYDNPVIRRQSARFELTPEVFRREICRARTFGFLDQVDALRAEGFARGGSLENAVVVSGENVLNRDGLRYRDEFVRHKILDAIGDLYLAGRPFVGEFRGEGSGHALNLRLLHALFSEPAAWREVAAPGGRSAGAGVTA